MKKVWILTEHYYPEETATGHILAAVAEGLTDNYEVSVICAQPTYHQRGTTAPSEELHNGVAISRCGATNFDKNVIWKRVINLATISLSIFFKAVWRIAKGDLVLVVTNPPLLPFLTWFASRLRGAKIVLLVHDVYPEVLVASGIASNDSTLVKLVRWANQHLYQGMDHVVVLGRDMKAVAEEKLGDVQVDVSIIPNWADLDEISPAERSSNSMLVENQLTDKFVIQYAGNMGYVHDVETIVAAAELLRDFPKAHFMFVGSGAKLDWLKKRVQTEKLENITLIPQQPRSEQNTFLNACDVAIMALLPGMLGVSVPSRSYNILAAGKPILALLSSKAEISLMIEEEQVGWVVPPQDSVALAAKVREIADQSDHLGQLKNRSREVAAEKYTFVNALQKFKQVFASLE